jgi:hypothetical protein
MVVMAFTDSIGRIIQGIITSFGDALNRFQFLPNIPGLGSLELIPDPLITQPGSYGLITYTFDVAPQDFGNTRFVQWTFIGPAGQETVRQEISTTIPEPNGFLLAALGLVMVGAFSLRCDKGRDRGGSAK